MPRIEGAEPTYRLRYVGCMSAVRRALCVDAVSCAALDTLFEKEDWMKATPEEVEQFIQRIREIGEI